MPQVVIIALGEDLKIMRESVKRVAASAAVIAGLATSMALMAAPANAASGTLQVCSYGNYSTAVAFPNRGWWTTDLVAPGSCRNFWIGTSGNKEPIEIKARDYNGRRWSFGTFGVRPSLGGTVITYGNVENHWVQIPSV